MVYLMTNSNQNSFVKTQYLCWSFSCYLAPSKNSLSLSILPGNIVYLYGVFSHNVVPAAFHIYLMGLEGNIEASRLWKEM